MVERALKKVESRLEDFIEIEVLPPMEDDRDNPHTGAVHQVSLRELEAMTACFRVRGPLNIDKWLQLFFPKHDDKSKADFPTLKKIENYNNEVYLYE